MTRVISLGVKKKTKIYILIILLCLLLLCCPRAAAQGVQKGLECMAQVLIPSLFPFMALSVLMIRSGFSQACGRVLSPVSKLLFRLDGSAAPVVFLSLVGGFPVGAKGIRTLYERNLLSRTQAERMALFCISAGPAFLITAVGVRMLGSGTLGLMLFVSQTLAVLLLGFLSRFIPDKDGTNEESTPPESSAEPLSDAIVRSAYDAAASMINMTALVVLFFALLEIVNAIGLRGVISSLPFLPVSLTENILNIVLEVSSACVGLSESGAALPALAFAVGWGGLCVHFQIFGILGNLTPPKWLFFLFRLLNASVSALIMSVFLHFFAPVQSVFASFEGELSYGTATHFVGGLALFATCVLFVLSFRQKLRVCPPKRQTENKKTNVFGGRLNTL